jgi:hypothetical protein
MSSYVLYRLMEEINTSPINNWLIQQIEFTHRTTIIQFKNRNYESQNNHYNVP